LGEREREREKERKRKKKPVPLETITESRRNSVARSVSSFVPIL